MCAKTRIALYGGTFDPIHLGHLEVAREVSKLFEIEKVLFVPAQLAPHKTGRSVTAPIHRYAMLALATMDDPGCVISTFELDAPNRRYTVDTVSHFKQSLGPDVDLYFIMGADSWSEITSWRDWKRLLAITNHIVVTRPGYEISDVAPPTDRVVDMRSGATLKALNDSNSEPRVFLTDVVMKDVSATAIREMARGARFEELQALVPEAVIGYLKKYGIYRNSNDAGLNS
jgi:nicotinate-nucleotide adenylyltransferase